MKMKRKSLVLLSILAVMCWAVVAFPPGAQATAVLTLTDGFATVTVADGGVGDANPAAGVVTYIGAVGFNWLINVTTGISDSPTPHMDLNSVDISRYAGVLDISFTDTGFSSGPGVASIAIGGTTTGTVSGQAWFDNGNVPFAQTTSIGSLGVFGGPAFSGTASSNVLTTTPFSLTERVEITHTAAGSTSFNATADVVPLPPTALLLGSGLLGLVILRRSRKS